MSEDKITDSLKMVMKTKKTILPEIDLRDKSNHILANTDEKNSSKTLSED